MRIGRTRRVVAGFGAALALVGAAGLAQAGPPEWPDQVWSKAQAGDEPGFYAALTSLPATSAAALDPMRESVTRLQAHIAKREEARAAKMTEVRAELAKHLEGERTDRALSEALKDAVELQLLSIDRKDVLQEEAIKGLVRDSEAAARSAEERHDWIVANELWGRLSLLFDVEQTYKADVDRQLQRLAMIRLYAPERLWKIRNDDRLANGEKPLPPYNALGDDFRQKLKGVDGRLLQEALFRSSRLNVQGVGMGPMLEGGIKALRVMASTPDLYPIFPGLANEAARQAFVETLDREQARISRLGRVADTPDLSNLLATLRNVNRETVNLSEEALYHEFGNGAMGSLDEFSAIIWPDELARFERSTQGKFIGVGIQIQQDEFFNIKVVTPLEGTPAQRAGIRTGDVIKRVNDQSAIGFTLDQAVELITGKPNTEVTLTIEREVPDLGKQDIDVRLRREEIKLRSVKGWRRLGANEDQWDWTVDDNARIGYIRLTQFHEETTEELDKAIAQLKKENVASVVLDLRFNPGGLLDQAVEVASRFIDPARAGTRLGGVVVSTENGKGVAMQPPERVISGRAKFAGLPVVVLVNESSASASEIVSGAIRDYADAGVVQGLLLGQRSYGKGSVQNVWYVGNTRSAALKLTTQYYKLPGGEWIHRQPGREDYGVNPNVRIDMLPEQMVQAFTLRQDADTVQLDEQGRPVAMDKLPDPNVLIRDGLDLQLETAVVLLQSQSEVIRAGLAAGPDERRIP